MSSIKVLTAGADPALDTLVSAFYARYPHYRVDRVTLPPGANRAEAVRIKLSEGAADVVLISMGMDIGAMVKENQLAALDPLVKRSGLDLAPFGPALEPLRIDGRLYDLPVAVDPWVILYNQEMFQAAGLPLPAAGWTWDQFRAAARALTRGEGESKVWGAAAEVPEVLVDGFVAQKGAGALADEKGMREALQFFHTMVVTDGSLQPARTSAAATGPYRPPFEQARAGMMLEQLGALRVVQSRVKFPWNVAPMPVHPGAIPVSRTLVRSYAIAAAAPNPEGAWTFLQFAAGPEGAAALAAAGTLPMYRTPEVKRAWLDRQPPPPAGTEALFETAWQVPARTVSAQAEVEAAAATLYSRVLSLKRPWEEALGEYLQQVGEIRAQAR